MSNDDVIDLGDPGSSDSADGGPWYPRIQRRFRIDSPIDRDIKMFLLTEYVWEQNEQGETRNVIARYLTEDGWVPFQEYETVNLSRVPQISGIDLVRAMAVEKKITEWERWITAMIDFGNLSESPKQEQQEHQNPQDDEDGGQRIVSHDRPVPTPVPDETPEATPADNQQPERTVTDD